MRGLAVFVLVIGLLAASVAAFARTEALKLERSPIGTTSFDRYFSPTCACPQERSELLVRIRRADRVDAAIVDADGDRVRRLAQDVEQEAGVLTLSWDGRDDAGRVVADGRYRLRVHLDRDRRTIVIPKPITVDTRPPDVQLTRVGRAVISPDGDGRFDRVRLRYRVSEAAAVRLLVNGEVVRENPVQYVSRGRITWNGRVAGVQAEEGLYSLALQAEDRAGNVSDVRTAVVVAVRYVRLDADRYEVPPGGVLRFRVSSDAESFSWTLRRPGARQPVATGISGEAEVAVVVPARLVGRNLVLRVTALERADRAIVAVRRG